ncbi:MAG: folate family ECF transporter S component [Eubacteriales bacterium]|nr:folate family ECF transporter S component [Eubacteriales bacterium]
MPKFTTRTLTLTALLTALEIVLSRFLSISAWNTKIGFAFVPVVIAALLLGPVWAGIAAALADFLGAVLFPVGPYFPGFTLTAFLMGAVYGLFLYRRQSIGRILGAVAVHQLALSLLLNTLWISLLYGSPYGPLLITRLPQCALLAAVQIVVIQTIVRLLPQLRRITP